MKFVVLCLIIFSAQNLVLGATLEEAHKELDVLIQIATNQSRLASSALNSAGDILKDIESEVITIGAQNVLNEYARLNNEFNHIVATAEKMGFNISKCIENKVGVLDELRSLASMAVLTCSNGFTLNAQKALDQGRNNIVKIVEGVISYQDRLRACQPNSVCVDTILSEIKHDQLDVPRKIREELDFTANKAEANRLRLLQCGVQPAEDVIRYGGQVIADIQACVDNIIDPKPSTPKPL